MAKDFIAVDRGQLLLMPPSLNEWLPEDHLVWTVLGAVEVMDLSRFNEAYRLGAVGRAAYDPQMMVALLSIPTRPGTGRRAELNGPVRRTWRSR
jgi:transposase